MAGILIVTEYEDMVVYPGVAIPIPQEPPLAVQEIDFTGTSAPSAAFNAAAKFVSIQLTSNGHVDFGTAPVAINTSGAATSRVHEAMAVSFHGVDGTLKIAAVDAA
ncbi:MAG: hypothetical protein KAR06_03735 [Deltaproteobacteria bacterium]|nr:hypothetical protein [Deltaproteobacteria bacterium]